MNTEPLELETAVQLLREHVTRMTETEEVSLENADRRVLAEDIRAERDQPPFPRSPLDGYALRSEDIRGADREHPVALQVLTEVDAGHWTDRKVEPGTAVRIMTGAPIPEGADAVLRQEDSDYGEDTVLVYRSLKPWQNYCFQGEDYKAGACLMKAGLQLRAVEIGILAGLGRRKVRVYRKPRLLLMSTGDELAEPGTPLREGQIYDSNLHMLCAQCRIWDVDIAGRKLVQDQAEEAAEYLRQNVGQADLILTTGGVSVGKKDIMHEVYRILGVERIFWKVRIKPGMPTLAGMYEGKEIISLSGNPYGAAANMNLLVKPVLEKMTGRQELC
ncbi:MAG TPA: molybdopterin molybdenumtransferase MoeA, partial [Lachnospiraceae bacterium]|nr:molybdopterin molybdenumtransferase MoeA [Lachnospiraceae bacterium]